MRAVTCDNPVVIEQGCPCLQNGGGGHCLLQRDGMPDNVRQQRFCLTDDYDCCPTYLSYVLTHSQSLRRDSDWLDAQL